MVSLADLYALPDECSPALLRPSVFVARIRGIHSINMVCYQPVTINHFFGIGTGVCLCAALIVVVQGGIEHLQGMMHTYSFEYFVKTGGYYLACNYGSDNVPAPVVSP